MQGAMLAKIDERLLLCHYVMEHVLHCAVTQTKSFFDLSEYCSMRLVELVISKRRVSAQENAGKKRFCKIVYTLIMNTIHTEDRYATPMQHQWRAPPSMSFIPVFPHSVFRVIQYTPRFTQTTQFYTYSFVAMPRNFASFCHSIY